MNKIQLFCKINFCFRLLIEIRSQSSNNEISIKDVISPNKFDDVITATKALGGFNFQSSEGEPVPSFKTPSIPLKIGYTLSKCAELLRGQAIKSGNSHLESSAERFLKLYNMEWSQRVSSVSLKTIGTNKFEKVQLLPVTEDLLKIREYLKVAIRTQTNQLISSVNLKNWRKLAEILATRLTIFNRRRASEVFNLLLTRYNDRKKWKDSQTDIKDSLSAIEKKLMERYAHIFIFHSVIY